MINEVFHEGIVVRTWKFADDLLFRLACHRDPDLPSKPLNETHVLLPTKTWKPECFDCEYQRAETANLFMFFTLFLSLFLRI